jgi:hypothetical protein
MQLVQSLYVRFSALNPSRFGGEAANHRITDAARLSQKIRDMMKGELKQGEAMAQYETEVMELSSDSSPLFSGH